MTIRLKAIDADLHVLEPYDLWQRYIEPKFAAAITDVVMNQLLSSAKLPLDRLAVSLPQACCR